MADFITNQGANNLLGAATAIVWASDTIKARLVASSATLNKDDTSMTPYTAIGTDQTLGSKTQTKDTANDRIVYDAADPTWTAVAGGSTVGWICIFKFVSNDAGSTPIAILDITDIITNGQDIIITFNASGIFYLQQ